MMTTAIAESFLLGLLKTGRVMATILGGMTAVLLALLILAAALWILYTLGSLGFDLWTRQLTRRWKKTGKMPAGRWAQILMKDQDHAGL